MIIFRLTSFFHEYIFFVCWTLFLLDHRCSFMMWWRKNSFRMDFKYHGEKCQFQMECDKFFYILIPFIEDYYRAKLAWSIVKMFECSSVSIYTRLMTLVNFWSCLSIFEKQNNKCINSLKISVLLSFPQNVSFTACVYISQPLTNPWFNRVEKIQ